MSNLTANFARPRISPQRGEGAHKKGGEGGWSKNIAREVPFIVLRPYLGHSNAFAWKINENVWQFHLMWKPHEPQFNCSILCGAGMLFFIRRSEWQKPLSDQAASSVRTFLFMNCHFYASPCERRQWLHNRKWRINIWGDQTHRPIVQSIPGFASALPDRHTTNVNKLLLKSNYVSETPAKRLSNLRQRSERVSCGRRCRESFWEEISVIRIDGVIKDVFEFRTLKRKDLAASHKMLKNFTTVIIESV